MHKPSFGVVTLATGLLAVFGVFAHLLAPLVPPPAENRMAAEASDYLRQAAAQRIDWHPLEDDAFAEARRQDLPILLAIGTSWSGYGRLADERVFKNPDIEAYLARRFVCVRVDALQEPRLLDAYLPVSRAGLRFRTDFQVWLLDPTGRMFDLVVHSDTRPMSPQAFLNSLIAARARLFGPHGPEDEGTPASLQREDLKALSAGSPMAQASFSGYLEFLRQRPDVSTDSLREIRFQPLIPQSWMFLVRAGRADLADRAVGKVLRSSMVDWLDGGFFHLGVDSFDRVEFDQVATQNAEMAELCAMLGSVSGKEEYFDVARATFDALLGRFTELGLVRACRIGTTGPLERSPRASFAPRKLRAVFPDAPDREAVRDLLGLRVEDNPQMVIRASDPSAMRRKPAQDALRRLREFVSEVQMHYAGSELMDVNGHVAARLMAAARMMGDRDRLQKAGSLFDRLEAFRAADDVTHSQDRRRSGEPYLGDYAAYADASLQDYLASGRARSLETGLSVLKRAVFLFGLGDGTFGLGFKMPRSLAPQILPKPGLGDDVAESCSARMIRLLNAYGRLFPEAEAPCADGVSRLLSDLARQGVGHFVDVAPLLGVWSSGYFRAALELYEDTYALAVGPDAQGLADALFRRVPARFVAPAYGPVRPDVQKRPPGVYLVSGRAIEGPLTPAAAAARLQRVRLVGE